MGADLGGAATAFDTLLISLSLLTAALVSQAVLSLWSRIVESGGAVKRAWLAVGSIALAAGVASMHLTATLVLRSQWPIALPLSLAASSLLLTVLTMALVLLLADVRRPAWPRAIGAGLIAGLAFAAIHFAGEHRLGVPLSPGRDWPLLLPVSAGFVLAWTVVFRLAVRGAERGWSRWLERLASGALVAGALAGATLATISRRGRETDPSPTGERAFLLLPESVLGFAGGVLAALIVALLAADIHRRMVRRRAATAALRRSEDRFRSLVQASSQIVWTTAPDGHMLGDQDSWAEFTGQSAEAYCGWGWFNAIHPADRERTARFWEETLANRRSMEIEHRVRRHDGHYRDCVARLVPVLEANGTVREWVGTHTDVTERARMQQERELLAEAGQVLSSSLDDRETLAGVARLLVPRLAEWCAIDLRLRDGSLQRLVAAHRDPSCAGPLRDLDPSLFDAAGASRAADEGTESAAGHDTESRLIRELDDAALRELAPEPGVARRLRELGGRSLLRVPLTARGHALGALTLASLEDDKPYDLRDLALAEELARRAAVAVDNARLYSTSQQAIQARDEILGIVSHDLRNPIGTVVTAADLLLQLELPPDEQRRHLGIIRRSAQTANRLIHDLLDVTQSDNGQLKMELRPTDPAEVLREACELMRPLAEAKSQRLTCSAGGALPTLCADPTRLEQVLSNLIGNAVKFTPEGGTIEIHAAAAAEEVRFSVSDTGPGIEREDLPRLFDRHWRASDTAHLGAGLGLAIARGIVEAHGGRIWAESEAGSGTTIHVTLPADSPNTESDERRTAADARQPAPQ